MRFPRVIGALFAVALCVALAGAALAKTESKPRRQGPNTTRIHRAKPASKPVRQVFLSTRSGRVAGESESDNVQLGDQTTADQPSEQSRSETTGDTEPGQPGEPAQGHEDQAGQDVNHECTGDCVE